MIKTFRCPKCKKTMERHVARNVVRFRSMCGETGKDVWLRRVKK